MSAEQRISDLSPVPQITNEALFEIEQEGTSYRTTLQGLLALAPDPDLANLGDVTISARQASQVLAVNAGNGSWVNARISDAHVADNAAISYSKLDLTNSIINADLRDGVVDGDVLASGAVLDRHVAASASISYSKLNLGSSITNADLASGVFGRITGLGAQSQDLAMGSNRITGLATPTAGTDAATKAYVDAQGGGGSSTLAGLTDVTISNRAANQILRVNSGNTSWVNVTPDFATLGANTFTGNQSISSSVRPDFSLAVTGQAAQLGRILFYGRNADNANILFAEIEGIAPARTAGSEAGGIGFAAQINGSTTSLMVLGSTITVRRELAMSSNKITGLAAPTVDTDAATKAYVDASGGGGSSTLAGLTDVNISNRAAGQLLAVNAGNTSWINIADNFARTNVSNTFTGSQTISGDPPHLTISGSSTSVVGSLVFNGPDSGGGTDDYASIIVRAVDTSAGSEDGSIVLQVASGGTLATIISTTPDISFSRRLDMNSNRITNLATPTAGADAATKSYVDSQTGGGGGSALSDGEIFVGSADGVATGVAVSGDISIVNTGVVSIAAGVVVNADIASNAAIAYSKLNLTGLIVDADLTDGVFSSITGLGAQSQDLAMGGNKITGLATPTAATDAATKAYVDSQSGGSTTLAGLTDVSISNRAANQLLRVNSGNTSWENFTPSFAGLGANTFTANQTIQTSGQAILNCNAGANTAQAGTFFRHPNSNNSNVISARFLVFLDGNTAGSESARLTYRIISAGSNIEAFNIVGGATPELNSMVQLDMNSNKIVRLAAPTAATDAATKAYVDAQSGGSTTLAGLTDVTITSRAAGQLLAVNAGNTAWVNVTPNYASLGINTFTGTQTIGTALPILNLTSNATTGGVGLIRFNAPNSVDTGRIFGEIAANAVDRTATEIDGSMAFKVPIADSLTTVLTIGGTITAARPLAMGSNRITGLATPTADDDAATKAYVDGSGGGGSSTLAGLTDVTITSRAAGQILQVNSGNTSWVNVTPNYAGLGANTFTSDQTIDSNGAALVLHSGDNTIWGIYMQGVNDNSSPETINYATILASVTSDADGSETGLLGFRVELSGTLTNIMTLASTVTIHRELAMSSQKITGLAAPTADTDAATKKYVDDNSSSTLPSLADGSLWIGNASAAATAVAISGDITLSNAGVAAIAAGVIVDADIAAAAAIAYSKLNLGSSIVNADVSASAAIAYSKLNLTGAIVDADLTDGVFASITGLGAQSQNLAMGSNRITGLATPTNDDDAATKAYVDGSGGGGSSTLAGLTDVTITSRAAGQILQVNSGNTAWINVTPSFATLGANTYTGAQTISTSTVPGRYEMVRAADSGILGVVAFGGQNDATEPETLAYSQIYGSIVSATDGSETGSLSVELLVAGTAGAVFVFGATNISNRQLSMNDSRIISLAAPTADADAANKAYVDTGLAGRASTGSNTYTGTQTIATALPILNLTSNSTTGTVGVIAFRAPDSASSSELFAQITVTAADRTSTSRDGNITFTVPIANTLLAPFSIGSTLTSTVELAMSSNKITGLATPTAATDAATKAYVDAQSGGGSTTLAALTDVTITSRAAGQLLRVNSGNTSWENFTPNYAGRGGNTFTGNQTIQYATSGTVQMRINNTQSRTGEISELLFNGSIDNTIQEWGAIVLYVTDNTGVDESAEMRFETRQNNSIRTHFTVNRNDNGCFVMERLYIGSNSSYIRLNNTSTEFFNNFSSGTFRFNKDIVMTGTAGNTDISGVGSLNNISVTDLARRDQSNIFTDAQTIQDTGRVDLVMRKTGSASTGGIATVQGWAQNSGGTVVEYGRQSVQVSDIDSGEESGQYVYRLLRNNAYVDGVFTINANNDGVAIRAGDRLYLDSGTWAVSLTTDGTLSKLTSSLEISNSTTPEMVFRNTGTGPMALVFRDSPESGTRQLGFINMFSTTPSTGGTGVNLGIFLGVGEASSRAFHIDQGNGNQSAASNIVLGNSANLPADATNGFVYIKKILANPTGNPIDYGTLAPITISDSSDRLYFYDREGDSWRYFVSAGGFEIPKLGVGAPPLASPGIYDPKTDRHDETICPLCRARMEPRHGIVMFGDRYKDDGSLHAYAVHLKCAVEHDMHRE